MIDPKIIKMKQNLHFSVDLSVDFKSFKGSDNNIIIISSYNETVSKMSQKFAIINSLF